MTKERAAKIILDMINGAESVYGHSLSTVEINALKKAYCSLNPEPTTNADRIRAMTDEELADFFENLGDGSAICDEIKQCGMARYGCKTCNECILNWLGQGVNDEQA